MSEGKLLKYRVVAALTEFELQEKLNLLADEGYIIHQFSASHDLATDDQVFYAIMKIDEGSYENVVALRDIAPELVTDALAEGWEITSTSLSTKFVRMIRRRKA